MKAQGKRFLTDRGDEGGSVRWYVVTNASSTYSNTIDATLYITDCYKGVALEFACYKSKHIAKRIAKLSSMISELALFKAALIQAQQESVTKKFCY
jgi:hypothetical protein